MAKTKSPLRLLDPDLDVRVAHASPAQLRALALQACKYALDKSGLDDRTISEAMTSLASGRYGSETLRQKVQSLVAELDEEQWDIQDAVERGEAERALYLSAFARARAANAVYFALDESPEVAATEALYEAHGATGDLQEILTIAGKALGKRIA